MTSQILTPQELHRLLAAVPLDSEQPDKELFSSFLPPIITPDSRLVTNLVTQVYFEPGELLFEEGDPAEAMYIIQSGRVVIFKGELQAPFILGYRGPAEVIGEMALLENLPRTASVVALEKLYAWRVMQEDFECLLATSPTLCRKILVTLCHRLRMADTAHHNNLLRVMQLSWEVAELQAEKEQFLELQEVLYNAGHAISDTIDLGETLNLILECLTKLVPCNRAAVLIQNVEELQIIAARGFPANFSNAEIRVLIKEDDVFKEIYQTQRPLHLPDISKRPDWQHVEGLPPAKAWLGVPLIRFRQVIGMLSLTRETAAPFDGREINLATTFTGQVAIALENARLYDKIAHFTEELNNILHEPSGAVQAAYVQLEVLQLFGTNIVPGDIFEALTLFLFYPHLSDLPNAISIVSNLSPYPSPGWQALQRLKEIGIEVAAYQLASSNYHQLAALARATDKLNSLSEYVTLQVTRQERTILEGIIYRWRHLIGEAGGEAGMVTETEFVANPYVAGNPVAGDLFVGREDILRHLSELWNKQGQCPSVVLYGHRRMGKTSILQNLHKQLEAHTAIVDFNMQRVGLVTSTGEMLYNLALAMYDSLISDQQEKLGEPNEVDFIQRNPYTNFDRFLKRFNAIRAGGRFIIMVDEFELIEQMILDGHLEARLLAFWRSLIQTYSWYIMAFAGLHTLQEMTRNYWHPLFGSVKAIPVSFLSHDAAWKLITQPTPDFALDYDAEAVERIITLTHGQPYLIQLIGHGLVTRFNQQTLEEGIKRERRFTLLDVEAIIQSLTFYHDAYAYFTGIWRLTEQGPPGQQAILKALVLDPATAEEVARLTGLGLEQTLVTLKYLQRHDIVMRIDGLKEKSAALHPPDDILSSDLWDFTVELMRLWLAQQNEI